MRHRGIGIALLLLQCLAAHNAGAQGSAPEPILEVAIDPPRVVVGQKTTLRIDVMAPNYMTSPPDLPDFQLRNAITRQLQSVNRSEERSGTAYAGVRFKFVIYPQEPGSYAIAGQKAKVRYAAEPPATREVTIAVPRIAFQAVIPEAASGLSPFIAAKTLTVEQAIQRSSDKLKAGDSVTRVITIKAEGTPAMLLPPMTFPAIDGLALYPAQPSLQDKTGSRTDVLSSTRVDSATYMLERPGEYLLPAIDVRWWNDANQKVELAHLDSVPLQVAANPAAAGATAVGDTGIRWDLNDLSDLIADHWPLILLAAIALAALDWSVPRAVRRIVARHRQRREAYRRSESFSFGQLRQAARSDDAKRVYFALLEWLQRFEPVAPSHTIQAFTTAARDPELDHEIRAIERELFTADHGAESWSAHQLLRSVGAARRRLRPEGARAARSGLPQQLNPVGDDVSSVRRQRMPAR
jgi:BatD DUF11 like domain